MATAHIESKLNDIASIVLMPGDPNRAKYIADNFLKNVSIVNKVRGMNAYTGEYKGKKVTIFPSGMGIPSMGIYSYELFNTYNVEVIIRIGTIGAYHPDLKLGDIVVTNRAYTDSSFAKIVSSKLSSKTFSSSYVSINPNSFNKDKISGLFNDLRNSSNLFSFNLILSVSTLMLSTLSFWTSISCFWLDTKS